MSKIHAARWLVMLTIALAAASFVAGCGDDEDPSAKTGPGATAGATGEEAGGFAVEAGKQRDPKDVEEEKKNFSEEPPPVQISSGNETGIRVDTPTAFIVQSDKELKALQKRHNSRGVKDDPWIGTDFKTRQYVGVFLPEGPRGSLIAVTDISESDGAIVIKVTRLLNGEGCKVGGSKPRPWHVVETRKMDGKPKLIVTDQRASACE